MEQGLILEKIKRVRCSLDDGELPVRNNFHRRRAPQFRKVCIYLWAEWKGVSRMPEDLPFLHGAKTVEYYLPWGSEFRRYGVCRAIGIHSSLSVWLKNTTTPWALSERRRGRVWIRADRRNKNKTKIPRKLWKRARGGKDPPGTFEIKFSKLYPRSLERYAASRSGLETPAAYESGLQTRGTPFALASRRGRGLGQVPLSLQYSNAQGRVKRTLYGYNENLIRIRILAHTPVLCFQFLPSVRYM